MQPRIDEERASEAIAFFEEFLTLDDADTPWVLHSVHKEMLRKIFGRIDEGGRRVIRSVYLQGPSKLAKTQFMAGIILVLLVLHRPGMDCRLYSAAASRGQAKETYLAVTQMIRQSADLEEILEIRRSENLVLWREDPRRFYKVLSGDAKFEDGIKADGVFIDELHRWVTKKTRELWGVLKKSSTTRPESLRFVATTPGVEGESEIAQGEYDFAKSVRDGLMDAPTKLVRIFEVPKEVPWDFEGSPGAEGEPPTGWYIANPGLGRLGDSPTIWKEIEDVRELARDAKINPSELVDFERYQLGRWVQSISSWLPLDCWDACKASYSLSDLKGRVCFAGLDLSTVDDMSALLLLFPLKGRIVWLPFFWLPEDTAVRRERSEGKQFRLWAELPGNNLELTPGDTVDQEFIYKRLLALRDLFEIREVAYDRWNAARIATDLEREGIKAVPVRQGFSLSASLKDVERQVKRSIVQHDGNPVLRWQFGCVHIRQNAEGHKKIVKPDYQKSLKRVDGFTAALMANDRSMRHLAQEEEKFQSKFEGPDAEVSTF